MKKIVINSNAKVNIGLRVLKKKDNGYHDIVTIFQEIDFFDIITLTKNPHGCRFNSNVNWLKNDEDNLCIAAYKLMEKNYDIGGIDIDLNKKIPSGSGLGGGSSNAANLLNYLNKKMKLKLNKEKMKKLASQIGFDVPISLEKKNTYLSGKRTEIFRLEKKFKLNLLIVYPNLICSTRKIYKKNRITNKEKFMPFSYNKKNEKFIEFLKNEKNDLEKTVIKIYPKIKELIDFIKSQKGCHFSRITGSGSACIGIFSNSNRAINAQKLVKLKYPKYWCVVSKSI